METSENKGNAILQQIAADTPTVEEVLTLCRDPDEAYDAKKILDGVGFVTGRLYKNSVTFSDEYGVVTSGRNLLSRDLILVLIKKLNEVYKNYGIYYASFNEDREKRLKENWEAWYTEKEDVAEDSEEQSNESQDAQYPYGYIYIMKMFNYYKIGKTKNKKRLGEYTRLPEEPEYVMIQFVRGMNKVEKLLHEEFKDKRLRNGRCEWFDLAQEDIDRANEIVSEYEVDMI